MGCVGGADDASHARPGRVPRAPLRDGAVASSKAFTANVAGAWQGTGDRGVSGVGRGAAGVLAPAALTIRRAGPAGAVRSGRR